MARPRSTTLEYISVDTCDKTTLKRISRMFGKEGKLFWWELLRLLGRTKNYYLDLSDEFNMGDAIEGDLETDVNTGESILNMLARWGNIDSDLWKNHKIVWCQDLIDRHKDVWLKRKETPQRPVIGDKTTVQLSNPNRKLTKDVQSEPETPQ